MVSVHVLQRLVVAQTRGKRFSEVSAVESDLEDALARYSTVFCYEVLQL